MKINWSTDYFKSLTMNFLIFPLQVEIGYLLLSIGTHKAPMISFIMRCIGILRKDDTDASHDKTIITALHWGLIPNFTRNRHITFPKNFFGISQNWPMHLIIRCCIHSFHSPLAQFAPLNHWVRTRSLWSIINFLYVI